MKLNKKGQIARFYKWSFGVGDWGLPTNFCPFFWQILFALAFAPITAWTLFIQHFDSDLHDNSDWCFVKRILLGFVTIGGFVAGGYVVSLMLENPYKTLNLAVVVIGITIGIILLFVAYCFIYFGLTESKKVSNTVSEIKEVVSTKFDSTIGKYCPKIDWSEKE